MFSGCRDEMCRQHSSVTNTTTLEDLATHVEVYRKVVYLTLYKHQTKNYYLISRNKLYRSKYDG